MYHYHIITNFNKFLHVCNYKEHAPITTIELFILVEEMLHNKLYSETKSTVVYTSHSSKHSLRTNFFLN